MYNRFMGSFSAEYVGYWMNRTVNVMHCDQNYELQDAKNSAELQSFFADSYLSTHLGKTL